MKSSLRSFSLIGIIVLLAAAFGGVTPAKAETAVAYDMVGSTSQNLTSYTNAFEGAFSSPADGFQKYQRGVSPSVPFSVLDDSLSIYPPDNLGIIKDGNTDEFFGVTDTENPDNSGLVSAIWVFDVSGASDLSLSIDMGAMGDFESSDVFTWTYQIDGGVAATAFENTVNEDVDNTYTLEGGGSFTLSDPMLMDGTVLTNDLQTFTTALNGTGNELTLTLTAQTDGGTEAFAFQNIVISEYGEEPPPIPNMIINEVDADTPSTDTLEFVELYDGGDGNTSLDGLVVVFYNGSGDVSYNAFDLDGYSTDSNGYFVLGNSGVSPTPEITFPSNGLQNGTDAVALYQGDAVDFPNGTTVATASLIDAVVYDTNDADDAGLLVLLNAGQPQVNENGSGDKDNHSNQRCPNGSGGVKNTNTYTQDEPTPWAANCVEPLPDIVINEVDSDTPSYDKLEFVELYDGGAGNTSLDGLVVVLFNGNDDLSYTPAFDLDGYITDANGYFVIGTVPENDIYVAPGNSGWLQNGADAVALYAGDADDFPSGSELTTEDLLDALVYDTNDSDDSELLILLEAGQPQVNEDGAGEKDDYSNQRCPDGSGGPRFTDTYSSQFEPTPGEANTCFGACGHPATMAIHDVQGSGEVSPFKSASGVIVEGVVVGDFQDISTQLKGFFLQEEDEDADSDPLTSEGIFVYDYGFLDVSVGDVVRVKGDVTEYYDLTELNKVSNMAVCGTGTATAAELTLPVSDLGIWEQYEGMLIHIPQTLYATDNYNQGRYGEVTLSVGDRLYNPTNVVTPGAAAIALQDLNDRSQIQLEDGRTAENPVPAPYFGVDNTLRAGDTLPELTGVVHYSFDAYEVHPTEEIAFTRVNDRLLNPPEVGGALKVASFNVLNYFTTLGSRGADDAAEFERQRIKIINAIVALNADVVGLMEIENHPADAAVVDLVNGLNDVAGAGTYNYIATGTIGTDAIKVALIYKPASVTPQGAYAILDSNVDPSFIETRNRPVLLQTFVDNASGDFFSVAVNHLKSKGSSCADIGDPDTGDGQGNCNLTRTSAATALANWLLTDPTGSGDPDVLIIGDLNAYAMEDPVTALTGAGYMNLVEVYLGADGYSYVFVGQAGYLDHALSSPALVDRVTGVNFWHINADEPAALDYNDYNQSVLYHPDPYRASDHDPVLIGLVLNLPPVADAGVDQTVYRNEVVYLEGTWTDPAGYLDELYAWSWDLDGDAIPDTSGSASYGTTINKETSFALEGEYTLTFSVAEDEGNGESGVDTVDIMVLNQAPDCSLAAPNVELLWPANHKFVSVEILGVTDPDGDTFTINIDSIFQDEPVDDGGDGSTWPDGQGNGTSIAEVRAERVANGSGRVYHIAFTADDGHGGICSGEVLVSVPHDSGKKSEAPYDDGPLYDSTIEPEAMTLPEPTEEPSDKDKKDK